MHTLKIYAHAVDTSLENYTHLYYYRKIKLIANTLFLLDYKNLELN